MEYIYSNFIIHCFIDIYANISIVIFKYKIFKSSVDQPAITLLKDFSRIAIFGFSILILENKKWNTCNICEFSLWDECDCWCNIFVQAICRKWSSLKWYNYLLFSLINRFKAFGKACFCYLEKDFFFNFF